MMRNCFHYATFSEDESTQVGAIVATPNGHLVSSGCNNFMANIPRTKENTTRPKKYFYTRHAEVEAIHNFQQLYGNSPNLMEEAILYATWAACDRCAQVIIDAGIRTVVVHKELAQFVEDNRHDGIWFDSVHAAYDMFEANGVKIYGVSLPDIVVPQIRVYEMMFPAND